MLPISNQTSKFILLSVLCCSGLEGSEKEVEKRGPPISYEGQKTGGVPIGIALGIALGRDLGIWGKTSG